MREAKVDFAIGFANCLQEKLLGYNVRLSRSIRYKLIIDGSGLIQPDDPTDPTRGQLATPVVIKRIEEPDYHVLLGILRKEKAMQF